MTRVLLTGGGGFVGRHIANGLLASGHEVTAVLRHGSSPPIDGMSIIETDDLFSADDDELHLMVADVDTVIHAAWYAEVGKYLASPKNLDCLAGTVRLARSAMAAGVKRFIGIGTCYEYNLALPGRSGSEPIAPDAPLGPNTIYGAAKAATFMALSAALAPSPTQFAWCRLFFLYGEGEHPGRLLPYVQDALNRGVVAELSEGIQVRDYLDVAEAGRLIVKVAEEDGVGPFNICSGEAITVKDLILSQIPKGADPRLLRFGARPMRADEPMIVVGRPGGLPENGWEN